MANYKKISDLEAKIREKDLEIAKYKQLIENINGLIRIINNKSEDYEKYKSIIDKKKELTAGELVELVLKKLDKEGLKLIVPFDDREYKAVIVEKKDYKNILKDEQESDPKEQWLEKIPKKAAEVAKKKIKQENKSLGITDEDHKKASDDWFNSPRGQELERQHAEVIRKREEEVDDEEKPSNHIEELKQHQTKGSIKPSEIKKKKVRKLDNEEPSKLP